MMTTTARHGGVHEWPLVVFTALTNSAAGVIASVALADVLLDVHVETAAVWDVAVLALGVALFVSLAHLGRPLRAPLALRRAGRNALSTEVLLAPAVIALGVGARFPTLGPGIHIALERAAGAGAALLLAAIGLVYFLPGRRPWRSVLVATPLVLGFAVGMTALGASTPNAAVPRVALLCLLLDAVIAGPAWMRHATHVRPHTAIRPRLFARRRPLVGLRLALVNAAPVVLLLAQMPVAALGVLLTGIVVDRVMFYGTACAETTEAEIARVEAIIAS